VLVPTFIRRNSELDLALGLGLDLRPTRRFDPRVAGSVGDLWGFSVTFAKVRMKMQLHTAGAGRPLVIVGGGLTGALPWIPHAEALAPRRMVARAQPLGVQLGVERVPLPVGYSMDLESTALAVALDDLGWRREQDLATFMTEVLGPGSSPREHPRWPVWNEHREALRSIHAIHRHH
jgi:hypothetical protein